MGEFIMKLMIFDAQKTITNYEIAQRQFYNKTEELMALDYAIVREEILAQIRKSIVIVPKTFTTSDGLLIIARCAAMPWGNWGNL
jgi:hypothetical protein